jgi:hypothetical protein
MPSFLDRLRGQADDAPEEPSAAEPQPIPEPESPGQPTPSDEPETSPAERPAPPPHHVSKPPRRGSTEERGVGPGSD